MPKQFVVAHRVKMEWIANLISWSGNIIIAAIPDLTRQSWIIFYISVFLVQILWAASSLVTKSWALLASCGFFGCVSIIGIFTRI